MVESSSDNVTVFADAGVRALIGREEISYANLDELISARKRHWFQCRRLEVMYRAAFGAGMRSFTHTEDREGPRCKRLRAEIIFAHPYRTAAAGWRRDPDKKSQNSALKRISRFQGPTNVTSNYIADFVCATPIYFVYFHLDLSPYVFFAYRLDRCLLISLLRVLFLRKARSHRLYSPAN